MEHVDLMRRLNQVAATITDYIPNPNYGGCGVVAGIVGHRLELLGVEHVEIVTCAGREDNYGGRSPKAARRRNNDLRCPHAWDEAGLSRQHLAVRFFSGDSYWTWDSDGAHKGWRHFGTRQWGDGGPRYTTTKPGTGMTVRECLWISLGSKRWNPTFRRTDIPKIAQIVNECFGGRRASL